MKIRSVVCAISLSILSFSALADVIYTPQEAFQDLASEKLTFVGRDYPNAELGPGGNYVCIYKNSRVYVRHEGCRPSHTQRLAVFSAKIISRNGGLIELYIEDSKNDYRLQDAGPGMKGIWKITAVNTPYIAQELRFNDLIQLEKKSWNNNFNLCYISTNVNKPGTKSETKCMGNAMDPQGTLEPLWSEPFSYGLKEAHDIIIKAPRA